MSIKFGAGCCCTECLIFSDNFNNRTPDSISADGVNFGENTIWTSCDGWHVDTTTDKLVCDTTDNPIYFHNDGSSNRKWVADASVTFASSSDYFTWHFGTNTIKAYFVSNKLTFDVTTDLDSFTLTSLSAAVTFPYTVTVGYRIFDGCEYETYAEPTPDAEQVEVYVGGFIYCRERQIKITLGTGFNQIGFSATSGTLVDNVVVSRAKCVCASNSPTCANICWHNNAPATLTLTLSGFNSGSVACISDATAWSNCINACASDCLNCMRDCNVNCWWDAYEDPCPTCEGDGGTCELACHNTAFSCQAACYASYANECRDCSCADSWNGTHVLDWQVNNYHCNTLACTYTGEATIDGHWTGGFAACVDDPPGQTADCTKPITATITYFTGGNINISVVIAGLSWSAELTPEEFCSGGTIALTANETYYNDELQVVCCPNLGPNVDCGNNPTGYSFPYGQCGNSPDDLPFLDCYQANHDEIEITGELS